MTLGAHSITFHGATKELKLFLTVKEVFEEITGASPMPVSICIVMESSWSPSVIVFVSWLPSICWMLSVGSVNLFAAENEFSVVPVGCKEGYSRSEQSQKCCDNSSQFGMTC